jgi:hypothetical protein
MFKKIEKPATCEMRSVIHFLKARNIKQVYIHRLLCEVYGEHAMSDSMLMRWVRHINERRKNVHDDHLWLMKIWCVKWKRRFKRTDDSPFRHFPCIFHKSHGQFFMKLCLINFVFVNCVHAGCRRCLRMNTKCKKRRAMLCRGVVMLHDNARPHTLPPQRKISSRHLAGNNSIIPPTAQT